MTDYLYHEAGRLKVYCGECSDVMRAMPAKSVHCVVTSPPYWGLRDYGTATWEGGDPECAHKAPSRFGWQPKCGKPLAVVETTEESALPKATTVTVRLAEMLNIPAYLVYYRKRGDDLGRLRVQRVFPRGPEQIIRPCDWAKVLVEMRNRCHPIGLDPERSYEERGSLWAVGEG